MFSKENKNKYYNLINGKPAIDHIFLRWFLGKYGVVTGILIPYMVLLLIPWDLLYNIHWYQFYIQWVSDYLPVINNVSKSSVFFPEYASAFLAFLNVIGIILVVFIFIFTLLSIELLAKSPFLLIPIKSLVFHYLSVIGVFLIVTVSLAIVWKVDIGQSRYIPREILEYRILFVFIAVLYWWINLVASFLLSFICKAILIRFKHRHLNK